MLPVAGTGIAIGLLVASVHEGAIRVVWNASPSVPIGAYAVLRRFPSIGELALVRLPPAIADFAHQRRYLSRSDLLIKPVVAIAGDRICRFGPDVLVQGRLVARTVIEGGSLLAWSGCRTLRSGEVFLLADHSGSFDSRYFGPLHARHVIGTAVSVW